jgi:hypothetical protein
MITVLDECPFAFTLMQDNESLFLTYMTGERLDVPVTIKLTSDEAEGIRTGVLQPFQLAERFRRHSERFKNRVVEPPILPTSDT